MTRKDYLLLAEAMKQSRTVPGSTDVRYYGDDQFHASCEAIAKAIHDRNPRFDKARFLKDCGVST
jgi:hypothetical protein